MLEKAIEKLNKFHEAYLLYKGEGLPRELQNGLSENKITAEEMNALIDANYDVEDYFKAVGAILLYHEEGIIVSNGIKLAATIKDGVATLTIMEDSLTKKVNNHD